jgi:hypothetical protein
VPRSPALNKIQPIKRIAKLMNIKPSLLAILGTDLLGAAGPNATDPIVTDPASYQQLFCYGVVFLFFAAFILRLFLKPP